MNGEEERRAACSSFSLES